MIRKNVYRSMAFFAVLLVLSGCGSGSNRADSSSSYYAGKGAMMEDAEIATEAAAWDYDDYDYSDGTSSGMDQAEQVNENAATTSRKLITTMNLSAETTELEPMVAWVEERVQSLGGYIESESVSNGSKYSSYKSKRSASMTLRIPAANLMHFVEEVTQYSNITYQSRSVEDVTLSYVDIDSRRKALRAEEEQLLSFMERAETIDDLIEIESRLTDVRYQIESAEAQLRTYDNKINYSTIYLDVSEVEIYTPVEEPGVGERITTGFMESLQSVGEGLTDFFVWFVTHIPQIVVFVIFVVIIILIIRKIRDWSEAHSEKREERREKRRQAKAEKAAKKAASKTPSAAGTYTYGFPQQNQPVQNAPQNLNTQQGNSTDTGKDGE